MKYQDAARFQQLEGKRTHHSNFPVTSSMYTRITKVLYLLLFLIVNLTALSTHLDHLG